MSTLPDILPITMLQPGEVLRAPLEAGDGLLVLRGRVRVVSPPGWFGDTVFSSRQVYQEGEVHQAGLGGWVEVEALSPAALQGLPQPVPEAPIRWSAVIDWLLGMLGPKRQSH